MKLYFVLGEDDGWQIHNVVAPSIEDAERIATEASGKYYKFLSASEVCDAPAGVEPGVLHHRNLYN
jgi:hypothetical protein